MENETKDIIKRRLSELPPEIRNAIQSTDLGGKFNAIAEKHSLRLDQNGALQTETLLVMLGLEPSDDYVENLERELGVSGGEARALGEEVNKEILGEIRETIRRMEAKQEVAEHIKKVTAPVPPPQPRPVVPPPSFVAKPPIAPIEKVGNFTVNRPAASHSPQYNDHTLSKNDVLADLEGIKNLQPKNAENYVEHLLPKPPETKPIPPNLPIQQQPEKKKFETDPYREGI